MDGVAADLVAEHHRSDERTGELVVDDADPGGVVLLVVVRRHRVLGDEVVPHRAQVHRSLAVHLGPQPDGTVVGQRVVDDHALLHAGVVLDAEAVLRERVALDEELIGVHLPDGVHRPRGGDHLPGSIDGQRRRRARHDPPPLAHARTLQDPHREETAVRGRAERLRDVDEMGRVRRRRRPPVAGTVRLRAALGVDRLAVPGVAVRPHQPEAAPEDRHLARALEVEVSGVAVGGGLIGEGVVARAAVVLPEDVVRITEHDPRVEVVKAAVAHRDVGGVVPVEGCRLARALVEDGVGDQDVTDGEALDRRARADVQAQPDMAQEHPVDRRGRRGVHPDVGALGGGRAHEGEVGQAHHRGAGVEVDAGRGRVRDGGAVDPRPSDHHSRPHHQPADADMVRSCGQVHLAAAVRVGTIDRPLYGSLVVAQPVGRGVKGEARVGHHVVDVAGEAEVGRPGDTELIGVGAR